VGIAATLLAIPLLQPWLEPSWMKAATVMGVVATAMIAADGVSHRLAGLPWGLRDRPVRALDLIRVGRKLVGFWVTVAALAAAYGLLPVYADSSFDPFREATLAVLPALVIAAPFYIAYVDCRQADPDDPYLQLSALLAGVRPDDWTPLRQHALGWIVKGFFLPLMFGYVTSGLLNLWSGPLIPPLGDFEAIFNRLIDLFYLLDVLLAGIAYTLTLRLLGSHIRSVEPTVFGWAVCLFCYPPFNTVTGQFLPYDQDGLYWGKVFAPVPALYVLWGSTILALVCIYMWSTAAFGLRFSNLTHRGIITSGPYRWSKHPAYISKNLSWWLISVPFIAGAGWAQAVQSCILLGGVNLIYFLRARTEERHLSRDPSYRDYAGFIARRGLFATFQHAMSGAR
jgi:protein-S-isoprenylcysteine O-methyltransferase Ste14